MNLKPFNLNEEALTREDLYRLKGGMNANYTTQSTGCDYTGANQEVIDCSDMVFD